MVSWECVRVVGSVVVDDDDVVVVVPSRVTPLLWWRYPSAHYYYVPWEIPSWRWTWRTVLAVVVERHEWVVVVPPFRTTMSFSNHRWCLDDDDDDDFGSYYRYLETCVLPYSSYFILFLFVYDPQHTPDRINHTIHTKHSTTRGLSHCGPCRKRFVWLPPT